MIMHVYDDKIIQSHININFFIIFMMYITNEDIIIIIILLLIVIKLINYIKKKLPQ
jgi:hypothetical protein